MKYLAHVWIEKLKARVSLGFKLWFIAGEFLYSDNSKYNSFWTHASSYQYLIRKAFFRFSVGGLSISGWFAIQGDIFAIRQVQKVYNITPRLIITIISLLFIILII